MIAVAANTKRTKATTIRTITAAIWFFRMPFGWRVGVCVGSAGFAERSDHGSRALDLDDLDAGARGQVAAVGGLGVPFLAAYAYSSEMCGVGCEVGDHDPRLAAQAAGAAPSIEHAT